MYYLEKCCSVCGVVNWDKLMGNHNHEHGLTDKKGRATGEFEKCDTNGEERKFDAHGHRVY